MKRVFLLLAGAALLLVPYHGIRLLGYARGIAGDLSITSILVLAAAAVAPGALERRELRALAAFVVASALFLYPMALGIGPFDPYSLGYPGRVRVALVALSVVGLVAWFRGRILLVLAIVLGLAAYRLGVLESGNLWDYLLDPWLSVAFAGFTIFDRFSKSR